MSRERARLLQRIGDFRAGAADPVLASVSTSASVGGYDPSSGRIQVSVGGAFIEAISIQSQGIGLGERGLLKDGIFA